MEALGENTIQIDCDVIQADGGTRTASITGAWIALAIACRRMLGKGLVQRFPLLKTVAAVSVGVVGGTPMLDLCYEEDSRADVDMNVVMTGDGHFVEVQGTAEGQTFDRGTLDVLTDLAWQGIRGLVEIQKDVAGV
jgi:ribonuclease PH